MNLCINVFWVIPNQIIHNTNSGRNNKLFMKDVHSTSKSQFVEKIANHFLKKDRNKLSLGKAK